MGLEECDDEDRETLIRLLEGDQGEEWDITLKALEDGRDLLREYQGHFGAYAINFFIQELLRTGFPMHPIKLGSGGTACVMNNADGRGLYIKLTVDDDRAVILSFHVSVHHKGD